MMTAMHGPGPVERMHAMEGAEQMMDQCTSMMATMDDVDMTGMRGMDGRLRHDGFAVIYGQVKPR